MSLFVTHFAPHHNEKPYSLSSLFSKGPFGALLQIPTIIPSLVAISPGNSSLYLSSTAERSFRLV